MSTIADDSYAVRRSRRARALSVTVYPSGEVKVTAPRFAPRWLIDRFVAQKRAWIREKVAHFRAHPLSELQVALRRRSRRDFSARRAETHALVSARAAHFNELYGFSYKKIAVRDQRTRWGSCSKKGTLSFNYKLIYLPPELLDYVVVHELCHLEEFNHGPAFWKLVERALPGYRELRARLRGLAL